jgi:hypothetical protein
MTFNLYRVRRKYRYGSDDVRFVVASKMPEAQVDFMGADVITDLGEIDLSEVVDAVVAKIKEGEAK